MRLIVARCEVRYTGRLDAVLPESTRLLMLKADGSMLVHADAGGYKPLNWMTPPTVIEDEGELEAAIRKEVALEFQDHSASIAALRKRDAELAAKVEIGLTHARLPQPATRAPVSSLNSLIILSHTGIVACSSVQNDASLRRSKSSTDTPCCSTHV